MVKIQEDLGVIPPADLLYPEMGGYPIDSNFNRKMMEDKYGFRLQELNHNNQLCSTRDPCEETTSVSGHSNYKQRIDSMFDDSRSVVSDRSRTRTSNSINNLLDDYLDHADKTIKNNIQEKIEKMFEEISLNGFHKSNSFRNFKSHKIDVKKSDGGSHDFKVIYLGSKSLDDKSVNLITLQEPLRDLYLEHKMKNITGFPNILTISKEGLKININESVTLNPFPTIAVWASVKFSYRQSKDGTEFAFLPLIKDPDGIDKNMLYRQMTDNERILVSIASDEKAAPPIFFVVMKNSALKLLECHGFICSSSEEAIVIAANLYQALMKKMKKRKDNKSGIASSSETTSTESEKEKSKDSDPEPTRKKTPPPVPARPPRKISKEKQQNEELISELKEAFQDVQKHEFKKQTRRGSVPNNIFSGADEPMSSLRRSVSERRNSALENMDGDILTKVAIPRSRSFLNANGPLTRYSRRSKTNAHSDGELTSPLGFNELFNEFRQNEGLENMDDILNAIIDAEGMSFNDLKPIYKEFLLKLAVTLTKDELFQRSKNIMRRQKKKNRSRSMRKKTFVSATGLRKVFRKTASKLSKPKTARPSTLEFTSVVFQSTRKHFETSTSSTCSSNVNKKEVRRRPSCRKRVKKPERKFKKLSTTSDDSDCFLIRNGTDSGGCPNRSSSGYFSCSECSYDSENCTCTSADKCYCTLGTKKDNKDKLSVSSCGRDTESCADSEKCYCTDKNILNLSDVKGVCQTPHLHQQKTHNANCPNYAKTSDKVCKKHSPTIFEQLKEQGFVPSDSSLSRAASPSTAWRNNEEKVRRPKECLKTSRSLEFLQIRPQRQQISERPPPPVLPDSPRGGNYVEGTRHYCYHGPDVPQTASRRRDSSMSYRSRRHFNSMRNRSPNIELTASRVKNRVFSSMRAKNVHDDIMNHVLFPERNGSATSSLRFTRRMDVYNSFQGRRCIERQGSYIDLLNQIQTRFQANNSQRTEIPQTGFTPIPERPLCQHDPTQIYISSGGSDNLQKLDYDLFTASAKSETSESISNVSERKVLVVSARDPRGKVLYMGASSRGENVRDRVKDRSAANASEALSVKKSAEIAALFSDVYLKQKIGRTANVMDHKTQSRANSYRLSNMENTLGYLP